MSSPRHFLTLMDLTPKELGYLIQRAVELKTMLHTGQFHEPLRGKTLGMIFEKSSTGSPRPSWVSRGDRNTLAPPNWVIATSNDTRVRVEDFSKIKPRVLPSARVASAGVCFSSVARAITARNSSLLRSFKVRKCLQLMVYDPLNRPLHNKRGKKPAIGMKDLWCLVLKWHSIGRVRERQTKHCWRFRQLAAHGCKSP